MSGWDEFEESDDAIPRDRYKRPMVVPAAGGKPVPYTRVTTFAGAIEDMYGLGQWQQRMVALGLAARPDLVLSVAAHSDDKTALNAIAKQASEAAAAGAAATTGTALHRLAERLDRGQMSLPDMPDSNRADLEAYAMAMRPFAINGIEQFVVIDELRVGGTFDRIVTYNGTRYVADIKTGSIEFGAGKMAIQLALYAHGWLYEPGKLGRSTTGVDHNAGIIIHLPAGAGECALYWLDIRAGWEAAELCDKVREWRKRKNLIAPAAFSLPVRADAFRDAATGAAVVKLATPPEPYQPAADLAEAFGATVLTLDQQIAEAKDAADLAALWVANRDEWTAEHTRVASLLKLKWHQAVLHRAVEKVNA